MNIKIKLSRVALGVFVGLFVWGSALASDKSRLEDRLTRLFYWQMSQALDLSTAQEKKMTQILGEITGRRLKAIDQRDALFAKMDECLKKNKDASTPASQAQAKALLLEYEKQLGALSSLDREEHEKLRALWGDLKLLKFYQERKSIVERIKKALN